MGSQRPRIFHAPDYVTSAGQEAIELAALAGLELDDWQRFVLMHALGERADGKWAAQTVGLTVGRQNGKGSILEARELAGLFLLGERVLIHTAHLQKTATNHFERVLTLIEGVPEFERRVLKASHGKGAEAIILRGGQRILFPTRARGGGRGLTIDFIAYDEAMYLSEQDRAALVPTMAARSMTGNTQSWYVGSAVDQEDTSQDGVPFAQVRESGVKRRAGVAYFEWSAPGDDPNRVPERLASDPEMWAQANPGLGIRISHAWVEHERTVEMGPRAFAVERLGIGDWPDLSEDNERVIARDVWGSCACTDSSKRIVGPAAFGIDASPDRTWASIGVSGSRDDALWHVAVVDHERGTGWLADRCVALSEERPGSVFVIDVKGPAAPEIPELEALGLTVVKADANDYANAYAGFIDAVTERRLRWPDPQPELDAALGSARRAPLGERYKWSRKHSTSADISPLVAVTFALWGAQTHEPEPERKPLFAFR